MPELALLIAVIAAAIGFGFVNGLNDAANSVAASIGSRSLSPRSAIILAGFFTLAGSATGLEVARTIGQRILVPEAITYFTLFAALVAVIVWVSIATRWGLPVSSTHSLLAGLAGAGMAIAGSDAVRWGGMQRPLVSVAAAPALGFMGGFVVMVVLLWLCRRAVPSKARVVFSRLQWLTTAFLSYSLGKNNGQMPIAIITMALVSYTRQVEMWDNIPWWIIIGSSLAISSGVAIGGWRVIRTMGFRITALQPIHGFAADFSAATVIEGASRLGIPVSTTHCATAAVIGIGATRRLSAVRWGVTRNIVLSWILTFPVCGVIGWVAASFLKIAL